MELTSLQVEFQNLNWDWRSVRKIGSLLILPVVLSLGACTSVYYKTMEKLGKEKRDILVQRVKDTKKDQEQTKQQIQTTMEKFQQFTGFKGGDLEKNYKKLNDEYDRAEGQANKLTVSSRLIR